MTSARGDQCDNCTKQLDPTDLINPHSTISGSTNLEVRETKHLLPAPARLRDKLEAWIDSKTDWPILTTSIAKKWLNDGDGLQDRGITRDLHWGIPVKEGRPALAGDGGQGLLCLVRCPHRIYRRHRRMGRCERLAGQRLGTLVAHRQGRGGRDLLPVHGQGQRALPHAVLPRHDPGSGEPWKLVDYLKSFNYLNYDGGQFSPPRARRVHGSGAVDPARPITGAGGC
jgi:methionyl-tRNA synthetase